MFGILKFALLLLVAVLVVFVVMFVGAMLVTAVSLSALLVLPTVRGHFVTLTERTGSVRPESMVSWRFVGVHFAFVFAYGFTLLVTSAALAETFPTVERFVPEGRDGILSAFAVVALVEIGGLVAVRRVVTSPRLRAVGEWAVFLCLVTVLVFVAAVVVPILLFTIFGFFV